MISDIIQILGIVACIIIIWFQRKNIFELERDMWEIEHAYREKVGTWYIYKHRFFQSWGNDVRNKKEE